MKRCQASGIHQCLFVASLAIFFHSAAPAADASAQPLAAEGTVQALFAPWDDVEEGLVRSIANARRQILVQAYLLTSRRIAAALIAAQRRGLDVRVLADAAQAKTDSSRLAELAAAGIAVWLETRYQHAHNKVIIIDAGTSRALIITGSFNFTWTAQHRNAENVLLVRGHRQLTARYVMNWERHQVNALPFQQVEFSIVQP